MAEPTEFRLARPGVEDGMEALREVGGMEEDGGFDDDDMRAMVEATVRAYLAARVCSRCGGSGREPDDEGSRDGG